jgi:hypothetical protein
VKIPNPGAHVSPKWIRSFESGRCRFDWPTPCSSTLSQIMQNTFAMVVVCWLATVSLLIVAYLTSLTIEEKRRNRRMNAERQRLGLSV